MNLKFDEMEAEELLILKLKNLYGTFGFKKFKMARFESYDFYHENKNYLDNVPIITFNNPNGQLMALKPDITLSIVKSINYNTLLPEQLYYAENVYRPSANGNEYKEIFQIGIEHLGKVDLYNQAQIIFLALKSLDLISSSFILCLSDTDYIDAVIDSVTKKSIIKKAIKKTVLMKNSAELLIIANDLALDEKKTKQLFSLIKPYDCIETAIKDIKSLAPHGPAFESIEKLETILNALGFLSCNKKIKIDFSIPCNSEYYKGLMFTGYIDSVPNAVLKGGRYDPLAERLHNGLNAIGFAIYFDELEAYLRGKTKIGQYEIVNYNNSIPLNKFLEEIDRKTTLGKKIKAERL